VSVKYRPSVGEVSVTWKAMSADIQLDRLSTDYQPTIDWVSTESRSSVDWQSTEWRSSIDWVLTATSTDIAVDITYSKHDPLFFQMWRCPFTALTMGAEEFHEGWVVPRHLQLVLSASGTSWHGFFFVLSYARPVHNGRGTGLVFFYAQVTLLEFGHHLTIHAGGYNKLLTSKY